ncbi:MAG: hypothetical protein ACK5QT_05620, partial [Oligoflexia bacterium]
MFRLLCSVFLPLQQAPHQQAPRQTGPLGKYLKLKGGTRAGLTICRRSPTVSVGKNHQFDLLGALSLL